MHETSSKSREHRQRVLEHQARAATERAPPPRAEAQGRMPLLVEVKARAVEKPAPAARGRGKARPKQARFEGL